MKAKLSKEAGGYDLYRIDEDGKRVTFASTQDYKQKLSLKNCQAIERGYDLDELAKTTFPSLENCGIHLWMSETDRNRQRSAFIKGFQKALELLGDKKFSEDDVNLAFVLGKNKDESRIGKLINSRLQQTEWEVTYNPNEKDADGCLILRKI